jgi:D-glycero-alpha-D-manno-heptose 1-phosphate guanylyltransferase
MSIDYAIESQPLGTGGAIRLALAQAHDDAVLALNGDTFLQADYADMMRFHREQNASATIAVVQQPDIARYGGVVVEHERVVAFEEKGKSGAGPVTNPVPGLINAGAYVLSRDLQWPNLSGEAFSIERDFFMPQVARLRPAAYEVTGYFLDIGVPADLDRAQRELAGQI